MNDEIRTSRKICRRAERKWKKDRSQVSFDILREALANFQSIVKVAKAKYFSNIINKVIFPAPTNCLEPTQKM